MSPVAGYLSNEKHLFEYLGLEIYLSTRDQQPLVIYGRSEDQLSTVVINFEDGVYKGIELQHVPDFQELSPKDKEKLLEIIDYNLPDIIKFWIDVFVYNKKVPFEKVLKPIQTTQSSQTR
jgi:hypothetical protein